MNGHYLLCPNCDTQIDSESGYDFRDVHSDIHGRDVITFRCCYCGRVGESFAFITQGGNDEND